MNKLFKINIYFDEKGEEIENLISYLLINKLEKVLNIGRRPYDLSNRRSNV